MGMLTKKLYHFVATEEMFNKINKFSSQEQHNFSKSMRLIIDTMMPLLDYYTIFEQESGEFGYNEFGAEIDIRFYIDPSVYRKLRNTHGAMHTFSIAVLVRKMVELFLILFESKGLEWVINAMKSGIKKIIKILCKTGKLLKNPENMVHMYGKDFIEENLAMIFSKNYTLLGVEYTKKRLLYQNRLGTI